MHEKGDQPSPTVPASFPVNVLGFEDAARAERFGHVIGLTVGEISRYIALERLDGITVSHDYDGALAQLDRGYKATRPLTRTLDDQLIGVAMAPAVLRDGIVKGHLVFYTPVILPLENETNEYFGQALYMVAHECAHIEDLKQRDECFPGTIVQKKITDYEEAILEQISGVIWEEYAACRISAVFGETETWRYYEEGLINVLQNCRDRANDAIRSYRLHGDLNRVIEEAGNPLCEPLRLIAYLTGHLDGLGRNIDSAPRAFDELSKSVYAVFSDRLGLTLRLLWSHRGRWDSLADFDPLKDVARDALKAGGMILTRLPGGKLYVNIPFKPETMPD